MSVPNFRPMGWQCRDDGCFNDKRRLKFGVFKDSLPGKISFTDIDGTVEVNGYFLFLEFKFGKPSDLNTGQTIYLERLTRLSHRIKAVLAAGDAETMSLSHVRIVANGEFGPWQRTDINEFKQRLKAWSDMAQRMPRFIGVRK